MGSLFHHPVYLVSCITPARFGKFYSMISLKTYLSLNWNSSYFSVWITCRFSLFMVFICLFIFCVFLSKLSLSFIVWFNFLPCHKALFLCLLPDLFCQGSFPLNFYYWLKISFLGSDWIFLSISLISLASVFIPWLALKLPSRHLSCGLIHLNQLFISVFFYFSLFTCGLW